MDLVRLAQTSMRVVHLGWRNVWKVALRKSSLFVRGLDQS